MPVRLLPVCTASNPCLSLVLLLFLPMVSMEETPGGSHPGLNESENFLSFNWTDSTSFRLAKQDPLACAMLDELDEGSVGLSREQSSSTMVSPRDTMSIWRQIDLAIPAQHQANRQRKANVLLVGLNRIKVSRSEHRGCHRRFLLLQPLVSWKWYTIPWWPRVPWHPMVARCTVHSHVGPVYDAFPWCTMASHGGPVYHAFPWCTTESHIGPVYHGIPSCTMEFHGGPSCHGIPWWPGVARRFVLRFALRKKFVKGKYLFSS